MAKVNVSRRAEVTQNSENAKAYKNSPEMELYLATCTSFLEKRFYEDEDDSMAQIRSLIAKCDKDYVVRLAMYARNEMNLRSVPVVLLVEAARAGHSVRYAVPTVCRRADELAEAVAYFEASYGEEVNGRQKVRNMPASLKRGLADAFANFNEYAFGKYKSAGKMVSLKDVVRIVHPKPENEERSALYGRIVSDSLAIPETWETYISENGSSTETWNHIAPSMGIFALLRNCRNFEKFNAEEAIEIAKSKFANKNVVQKSRILPFRWLAALENTSRSDVQDAIRGAIELSIENMPMLPGSTAIFSDNSGSMGCPLSGKSTMRCIDAAAIMSALALHRSEDKYVIGAFGRSYKRLSMSRHDSVLTNAQKVRDADVGHATYTHLAIDDLIAHKTKVDRIFIFSDMQCYGQSYGWYGSTGSLEDSLATYRKTVNKDVHVYSVDLAGYGTSQFNVGDTKVAQLAGFSDKLFDFAVNIESARNVLNEIKNYGK